MGVSRRPFAVYSWTPTCVISAGRQGGSSQPKRLSVSFRSGGQREFGANHFQLWRVAVASSWDGHCSSAARMSRWSSDSPLPMVEVLTVKNVAVATLLSVTSNSVGQALVPPASAAWGWGVCCPGMSGSQPVRYRYRLLPHMIAPRFVSGVDDHGVRVCDRTAVKKTRPQRGAQAGAVATAPAWGQVGRRMSTTLGR